MKRFREEIVQNHSGIRCQEIVGVDWTNREQVANYYKGEKLDMVVATGEILEER